MLCTPYTVSTPLAQNQHMQKKTSWGINLCVHIQTGSAFVLARIQETILEEPFSTNLPNLGGNGDIILVRMHAAPVFARPRIQEQILGKLFMYWLPATG